MLFTDFIQKLSSVIRGGASTDKFTRTIFEAIVTDEGQSVLDEYKTSSYKAFYNGNTSIRKIAQKINAYIEPMEFSDYIQNFSDAAIENLCNVFSGYISDIKPSNAADKLAELLVSIITEAAGSKKIPVTTCLPPVIIDPEYAIAPDLSNYQNGVLYMQKIPRDTNEYCNPFKNYIYKAR